MSSIAIFPCSSTDGSAIANELSAQLNLKMYTDTDLFNDTVANFGGSAEKLKKMMYDKTSVFNQFTLEKESSINKFRLILADKLKDPDGYLFYGLHAALIPQTITEVLRVLVVDHKKDRIERAMKTGISPKEARKNIRKHDTSAFNLTDHLYKKEAYDSSLYDLVIPVEKQSVNDIVGKIIKFYHKTSVLRTEESQAAVRNMKTAAIVEQKLLVDGHNVPVKADGSKVTLTVENSVFNFSGLQKYLTTMALQVDYVKEVEVKKSKSYEDSVYRQQKFELPSKVLFVDDEKEFVQTVSQRLISRDVGTYGVFNGEEALEIINEDRPDVMVLDLKMPGLHGIEVLRRAKEIAPEVEVIILTGHGTIKDEQECMELGAFAYLNKPVDIEQLSAAIKAANNKAVAQFSH